MSPFAEIEAQVARLSREELASFNAWFEEYMAQAWDRQIEADSLSGRLDPLVGRAIRDDADGKSIAI